MVDLVLEGSGQEPRGLDAHGFAQGVSSLYHDGHGSLDDLFQPRDGQAPFRDPVGVPTGLDDLGIDERIPATHLLLDVPDIHDHHPQRQPDLRSREADALRVVHGLEHVLDQLRQLWIELRYVLGRLPENRVTQNANLVERHRRIPAFATGRRPMAPWRASRLGHAPPRRECFPRSSG